MFLYGELSVVISAMAVWMDLKDASVDNGWILFSFMIGSLIQITENGPKGGVIFLAGVAVPVRSEERRVGKECRSRWSPDH